jgi:hypothetical protein
MGGGKMNMKDLEKLKRLIIKGGIMNILFFMKEKNVKHAQVRIGEKPPVIKIDVKVGKKNGYPRLRIDLFAETEINSEQ